MDPLTLREHNGTWSVSTDDDTDIVSFSGPHAREWAVRQHRELTQLLNRAVKTTNGRRDDLQESID